MFIDACVLGRRKKKAAHSASHEPHHVLKPLTYVNAFSLSFKKKKKKKKKVRGKKTYTNNQGSTSNSRPEFLVLTAGPLAIVGTDFAIPPLLSTNTSGLITTPCITEEIAADRD